MADPDQDPGTIYHNHLSRVVIAIAQVCPKMTFIPRQGVSTDVRVAVREISGDGKAENCHHRVSNPYFLRPWTT